MTIQGATIRVLVADDSAVYRTLIATNLSSKSGVEVIGIASNAYDAQEKIRELQPDVLILDVEMPKMTGIELTKKLMASTPLPIILISSANINVFDALQAGAVDFVKKPDSTHPVSPGDFVEELAGKIKIASVAKVSMHLSARPADPKNTAAPSNAAISPSLHAVSSVSDILGNAFKDCSDAVCNSTIIALGASTGGTEATYEVLRKLPAKIPPILIVQHMPIVFTKLYAERLDRLCAMNVKEAQDNDVVVPGQVYIAPGDRQMRLVHIGGVYRLQCRGTEKVSGHCPSVDALFESVAKESSKKNVGIIMTGMGKDGASGLLEMRNKGAYTIGESQESCVVYGMPMVAQNIGAVMVQATNKEIPSILMKHLNTLG
ncbi:protein-glutamate methylesterase/protein-glutamine glutaminase [Aminipila luticellarii]|uniref:Protein-glutamate methylesterase/protein-glutamine glutaminase n=1 Tax=Aminipila luticellarii TaxID=2507160 RepID=A0A410PSY7_9FIRM|nr:chemotaxis response regulator protein-glutamate methylesterase [Aminipila luticellarii]QAT42025.1 chemotaxis response regulator protein-glutamate methylesterase [Aminipila luticellarii]